MTDHTVTKSSKKIKSKEIFEQPQIPPELHDIANRVLALFQGRMVSPAPEIERRA